LRGEAAEAQRQALRLLALLADILAAALLLEEARESLAKGEERKSLIARFFIESHFSAAPRGSFPEKDWLYRQFEELTKDAVIPPPEREANRQSPE
jgi:hypothetical protein